MQIRTQDTAICDNATGACVSGETFGGQPIEGCDGIRVVPPMGLVDGQEAAPAELVGWWLIPASAIGIMAAAGFRGHLAAPQAASR